MIKARVVIAPEHVEIDFGDCEFVALPRVGENLNLWDGKTNLPVTAWVEQVCHSPRQPAVPDRVSNILIVATREKPLHSS